MFERERRPEMIRSEEYRKGGSQLQFSLAALESGNLRPKARERAEAVAIAQAAVPPYEVDLSDAQLLVGVMFGICLVVLVAWGFVGHWLFVE
jgi:hypothetical protein